jgi:hypothetical protein
MRMHSDSLVIKGQHKSRKLRIRFFNLVHCYNMIKKYVNQKKCHLSTLYSEFEATLKLKPLFLPQVCNYHHLFLKAQCQLQFAHKQNLNTRNVGMKG